MQGLVDQAEQWKEEKRARRHVSNDQKDLRELWHYSAICKWEPAEESQRLVGVLGDQNVLHGDQDLPPSSLAQLARGPGAGAWCRCHPSPLGGNCPVLGCLGPDVLGQAGQLPASRRGCHSL